MSYIGKASTKVGLICVTNFSSDSFVVYQVKEDGKFGKMWSFVMHEGSSVNPDRQTSPHPHCSIFVKIAD